jgi:hypothetical protein
MPYDRLPLLSVRAMLPGHENLLKAVDRPGGERTADVRHVAARIPCLRKCTLQRNRLPATRHVSMIEAAREGCAKTHPVQS